MSACECVLLERKLENGILNLGVLEIVGRMIRDWGELEGGIDCVVWSLRYIGFRCRESYGDGV